MERDYAREVMEFVLTNFEQMVDDLAKHPNMVTGEFLLHTIAGLKQEVRYFVDVWERLKRAELKLRKIMGMKEVEDGT